MNILIIGPTGSGKTSVAKELSIRLENTKIEGIKPGLWFPIISGDIARSIANDEDVLGFSRGELFKDERLIRWKVLNYINNIYYNNPKDIMSINFIFDSFPRWTPQYLFMLYSCIDIDIVFYLHADLDVVRARIKKRNRDKIDNDDTVVNRYVNEKPNLIDLYSEIKKHGVPSYWLTTNEHNVTEVVTIMISDMLKVINSVYA